MKKTTSITKSLFKTLTSIKNRKGFFQHCALALLGFSSHIVYSQNYEWAKSIGGTGYEYGASIITDAAGNVYSTGYFTGTVDFDPGTGTTNLTSVGGSYDVFISKLDAMGNFVWAKSIGSVGDDFGYSIKTDANGNVYTTGSVNGTADFDPGIGVTNLTGTDDSFISKLDASGNFVWAKIIGSPSFSDNAYAYSITLDAAENVYTTGTMDGTVDFDSGTGTTNLTGEIFISKLDATGNFVWATAMGGTGSGAGFAITTDATGNVYITGGFSGTMDFDPGTGTTSLTSIANSDVFICKLNAMGSFVWVKSVGGTNNDRGNSIVIDASNNVYTTGFFQETVDFDPGTGTTNLTSAGIQDIFITKLDATGNFVWAKRMGGLSSDQGYSITTDVAGNIYSVGSFAETVDFDPGTGTTNLTSTGSLDIFISKLDATGNFVWAKNIGGTGVDEGFSITTDAANNVYTTGQFQGTVDFDPVIGTANYTSAGSYDVFISKLSQCSAKTLTNNVTACSLYTWKNGTTYTTSVSGITHTVTGVATGGCDSIYTLNLIIPPSLTTSSTLKNVLCNGGSTGSATITVNGGTPNYTYLWSTSATTSVITGQTTGVKTVTVTDANGCVKTHTVTISQPPVLIVSAVSSSTSICVNGFATLTVSATGGTPNYTGTGTFTTNVANSVYSINDANNCIATLTVATVLNPLPTLSVTTTNTLICVGQTATLAVNGASNYIWNTTQTTMNIAVSPTATTVYTVTGTNTNGCKNTITITQMVDLCTGINSQESFLKSNIITVYPNPSNGLFIVDASTPSTIELLDILGQTLLTQKIEAGKQEINITNYVSGMYYIKVKSNEILETIVIMKY